MRVQIFVKVDGTQIQSENELINFPHDIVTDYSIYGCIFYQIMSNAIKHSPSNSTVDIRLEYLNNKIY